MSFGTPSPRSPQNLLGGNQASTLNCQFTYYPSVGPATPISLDGSLVVVNGAVANPGGTNQNQLMQKLYAQSGAVGGACPTNYTTSGDLGFIDGSQIVGTVTGSSDTGTGLYELEPMIVAGGAVLIIIALAVKGIEWARRIIENVDGAEDYVDEHLEGYLHPNGRVATVVKVQQLNSQEADISREKVLGVWSLDSCEKASVEIVGTMDDMVVLG